VVVFSFRLLCVATQDRVVFHVGQHIIGSLLSGYVQMPCCSWYNEHQLNILLKCLCGCRCSKIRETGTNNGSQCCTIAMPIGGAQDASLKQISIEHSRQQH